MGDSKKLSRNIWTQRAGCFLVDDELGCGWLLDGQVAGLLALEDRNNSQFECCVLHTIECEVLHIRNRLAQLR